MKLALGLTFIFLMILYFIWVYKVAKKYPGPTQSEVEAGKQGTHDLLKIYYKKHGKKVLPLIIAIAGMWALTLVFRLMSFLN